jgi:hypothetical protein
MEKILIVDDNKDQRETNRIRLQLFLRQLNSSLEVVDIFPFDKFNPYLSYIENENVIAIVLDEKLYNDSQPDKAPVEYNGSDIVSFLRTVYKYIPIFTLTNFPEDQILQDKINEYDYIFSKKEFTIKQVEIIQRACQRFLLENQKELSEFNDLTIKIASGLANNDEVEKLKAIQQKLNLPTDYSLQNREEWLQEFEEQIRALESLKKSLETKLNDL